MTMKQVLLSLLILLNFISCREVEEKFLYESDDPRIVDLQRKKCLNEDIYTDIELANNDFSRFVERKTFLFKRTSKVGDSEPSVEDKWCIHITSITPAEIIISIRKPPEVYSITYPHSVT